MKKTILTVSILGSIVLLNVLFTTSGCSSSQPIKGSEDLPASFAILPADLEQPQSQVAANTFAWQTFIAMNWPADKANCGPDTSKGSSILSGKGPVVWETYLTDDQVFNTSTGVPENWCAEGKSSVGFKSLPQSVQDLANKTGVYRIIHHTSKSPHGIRGMDEAVGGPLVDQNGRFVRYEIRMNKDEYMYITTNKLYDTAGQNQYLKNNTISFPAGTTSYGPVGAMEFKAAWKIIGKNDDASKFYTIKAIVYNDDEGAPSPGENPVTLGLVGLHIARKTPTQNNWVWATFEQVDNLTKSFYNPNCNNCDSNAPIKGKNIKELDSKGNPLHAPTQVIRVNPVIDPAADSLNKYFQGLLKGSVWANYQLISTQWVNFEALTPLFLANSVQETYVQGPNPASYGYAPVQAGQNYFQSKDYNPFAPGISSSCMGCHYVAKTYDRKARTDFSFMLGVNK